ncbi:kinase-like protein [Ramaria rubella]|nr:kinase-like protein [Ramaria rubella]
MAPGLNSWTLSALKTAFRFHSVEAKSFSIPEQVLRSEEPLERYEHGGYHPVNIGDMLDGSRYTVLRKLGWGQYSTVWLAMDGVLKNHVAVKILTAKAGRGKNKLPELDIHLRVQQSNPEHPARAHISTMLRHFEHVGPNGVHICMLFDVLGVNVEHIRRRYTKGPMPLASVKHITRQVLAALDFLHVSCGIIHTDVKPDNILICPPNVENLIANYLETEPRLLPLYQTSIHLPRALFESQPLPLHFDHTQLSHASFDVKSADLGVCNWVDNHLTEIIQSPGLRAPEVVLGARWDTSVDIWGFACVLTNVDLCFGQCEGSV